MKCATYFKAFSKLRYFALIGPYFFNRKTLFPHMHLGSESGVGSSGDKCLWSSHLGTLCTLKNVYPDFTSLQNLFYQRAIVDKGVWHSGIHSACQPDELGSVWPVVLFLEWQSALVLRYVLQMLVAVFLPYPSSGHLINRKSFCAGDRTNTTTYCSSKVFKGVT